MDGIVAVASHEDEDDADAVDDVVDNEDGIP